MTGLPLSMLRMDPPTRSDVSSVRSDRFSIVTLSSCRRMMPERSLRPTSGFCPRSATCVMATFSSFASLVTPTDASILSMTFGTSTPDVPTGCPSRYKVPSLMPISPISIGLRFLGLFGFGVRALIIWVMFQPVSVFSMRNTGWLMRMLSSTTPPPRNVSRL